MDKRYTETELAQRWGVTTRTLQKWRRKQVGPAHIVIGINTILYREEDVVAYEQRAVTGGEIPPRALTAIKRAAGCLDRVAGWKIAADAAGTIAGLRDELRALLGETP